LTRLHGPDVTLETMDGPTPYRAGDRVDTRQFPGVQHGFAYTENREQRLDPLRGAAVVDALVHHRGSYLGTRTPLSGRNVAAAKSTRRPPRRPPSGH
jgi:hypothetical protein